MTARVGSDFVVVLRVPAPDRPNLPLLECIVRRRRARTEVAPRQVLLRGELCAYTVRPLRDHIERCWDADSLVLDLREVTFLDGAALRTFDELARRWAGAGLTFRLAHPSARARKILEIVHLEHLVDPAFDPMSSASGS